MAMASGAVGGGGARVAIKAWGFLFHHRVLSSFSLKTTSSSSSSNSWRRSFSSSTADAVPAEVDGGGGEEKKMTRKRRKKRNLFDVAKYLPNWGIGYLMRRNNWSSSSSYRITRINLYKGGRHGKAWGIFHKHGLPVADRPKRINNAKKLGWKYVPESKMKQDSESGTMEKSCYTVPEPKLKQDSETSTVEKSCYVPEPKSKQDSKTAPVEKSGYVPESKIKQDSESGTIETSSYSTDQS